MDDDKRREYEEAGRIYAEQQQKVMRENNAKDVGTGCGCIIKLFIILLIIFCLMMFIGHFL